MFRLTLESACSVPWNEMERRSGGRHCAHCDKRVHDLTAVTEVRARALTLLHGGGDGLCARIRSDVDGYALWKSEDTARTGTRARVLAAAVTLAAPLGCGGGATHCPETSHAPPSPLTTIAAASAANETPPPVASADVDSDGDGVPDRIDKCPKEAGPADNEGCPKRFVGIVNSGAVQILERPHFAIQGTRLPPDALRILDEVAAVMKEQPSITLVHVIGNADNTEPSPEKLSLARATAVVDYLVKAGVDKTRLSAEGKGSTAPLSPNSTSEGRASNRRVDFKIDEPPPTQIP